MRSILMAAVAISTLNIAVSNAQAQQNEERVVESACNIYVSKDYSPRQTKTETCKFAAPESWRILSVKVEEVENFKGRGSYTHNTYAAGQEIDSTVQRLIEMKQLNRFNFDASFKKQDAKLMAEIEEEYRQLTKTEESFKSSHNFLEVQVTASGGRFSHSKIRVTATVTLWKPILSLNVSQK